MFAMPWRWLIVSGVSALVWASPAAASEKYLEFVKGLRERDYHDFALLYLDQLAERKDLPADIRQVLPYERAMTLLDSARSLRNPDEQNRQLDQARTWLDRFLKESPNHPSAAQANAELAKVYIGKGKVAVQQSQAQQSNERKAEFQKQARAFFGDARKVLQDAHDRYKAEYEKHDKSIPKTDKARYEARERPYVNYQQAQLDLAELMYEEAQSYDPGSAENRKRLTEASNAFEQIHIRYRQQLAGLYAKMWQGKCFQEQGDLKKALGLYGELLDHGGGRPEPALKTLQDRVRGFRLICLNNDPNHDNYQVAIDEAQAWIRDNRTLLGSKPGLVIQWELVRALDAKAREEGVTPNEKTRLVEQALGAARAINRYAGEYKNPSTTMIQRLQVALNREPGDPKDFSAAFNLARTLIEDIRSRNIKIDAARGAEREQLRADLQPVLRETARVLNSAVSLANSKDDEKDVGRARYLLSYVYYAMGEHSYDSAILAEYVARRYLESAPDLALDAAWLAQNAWIQAYYQEHRAGAPSDPQDDPDLQRVMASCNFITDRFPGSDKSNHARMMIGKLFTRMRQPAEAAKWYLQVPESAPDYLEAQLEAGNAYWIRYTDESIRPETERLPKEELDTLARRAREIFQAAVSKYEAGLSREIDRVDPLALANLTRAKFSFAQILNVSGEYQQALDVLTAGPLSVVEAVEAPEGDEQQRPAAPAIKSREFASFAHQQVLRASIGLQNLDKAKEEMKILEQIEGAGGSAALTRVYLDLGRELQKEVERLQASRDPRLADVLKSFENLLEGVVQRTDGRDYSSLMWVAETYRALGDGLDARDSRKAGSYYARSAAALQAILDEEQRKPGYIPASGQSGVRLRIAMNKRRQKSFAEAETLLLEILKDRPQALDVQVEAAQLYQDWAAKGSPPDVAKWQNAISGDQTSKKKDKRIWGWAGIAQRMEVSLMQSADRNPEFVQQYLDARYNVAWCRYQAALAQSAKQRADLLEDAKMDIRLTAIAIPSLGGDETRTRFNKLYRDVQETMVDAGIQKGPIADIEAIATAASSAQKATGSRQDKSSGKSSDTKIAKRGSPPATRSADAHSQSDGSLGIWPVVLVAAAGCGAAAWVVWKTRSKPRRRRPAVEPEELFAKDTRPGTRTRN